MMVAADINMIRGCSPGGSLASDPMLSTETSPASDSTDRNVDAVAHAPMQVLSRPRRCPASSSSSDDHPDAVSRIRAITPWGIRALMIIVLHFPDCHFCGLCIWSDRSPSAHQHARPRYQTVQCGLL